MPILPSVQFKSFHRQPLMAVVYFALAMLLALSSQKIQADVIALEVKEGAAIQPDNLFPRVKMETNFGDIVVELDRTKAPTTVDNFLLYVSKQSFDSTVFHRIIDGFVVQGGGYGEDYRGLPAFAPIINESGNGLKNKAFSIAMARNLAPHTATRQFYFNMADNATLDPGRNWGYTVFGEVLEGTEILEKMAAVPTEYNAKLGWRDVPVEPVILKKATIEPETPL